MDKKRSNGILLHITSLPSRYGIGDLGPAAYDFVDRLAAAKQHWWQILPLNPTEVTTGNSPYSSQSAFAGNPLLISLELLMQEKFISATDLKKAPKFSSYKVNFSKVIEYRQYIWDKAYKNYMVSKPSKVFAAFQKENASWLEDHALFMALKVHYKTESWLDWPDDIRDRDQKALREMRNELQQQVLKEQFLQFLFFQQWDALKKYCHAKKIKVFGDLPFYVDFNSVDVWCNPEIFKLDKYKKPKAVAGVPPDYFSETGQLWGNPVYDWQELKKQKYEWWLQRIRQNMRFFDLLRLDHFRAFSEYWEVPAGEETAIGGKYQPGPKNDLFDLIKKDFPKMPFIAEDLGDINEPVRELMYDYRLPGMRLLLFGFGGNVGENIYAPHHYIHNCIAYTGTHDNNTVRGWWEKDADKDEKKKANEYLNQRLNKYEAPAAFIKAVMQSVADTTIFPLQDILGLSAVARMNTPSVSEGNWQWRISSKQMRMGWEKKLMQWTELYGRERV